ncbi:MAG: thioredoxin [bacterium]
MSLKNFSNEAKELTEKDFDQEILNSSIPVIVDFWAEWCMPCKMLSPIVEEVAREMSDKIKAVKVNVDENPNLAIRYNIQAIPTLLIFKGGSVVSEIIGYVSKKTLVNKLSEVL